MKIDRINKLYWLLVILMAVITIVAGYIGWGGEEKLISQDGMTANVLPWEILTRVLLLFIGEGQNLEFSNDNWALWIARLSALLCVLGAAVRVLLHLAIGRFDRWRISKMKNHTIICGLGETGRAFVRSEQKNGRDVVVINKEISHEDEIFLKLHDASHIIGDCREEASLRGVAIIKSHCVIIVTGEDTSNLETLNVIRSILADAPKIAHYIPIYLEIAESAFWQKTSQADLIEPLKSQTLARPFNRHSLVARSFIWHHPLYSYADLQDQNRIHCVFWGYDEHVEALIERIATSCIYKSFGKIKVSILAYGIDQVQHFCESRFCELQNIVDFSFYQFDWQKQLLDEKIWETIVADCPPTTCFYTGGTDKTRLQKAISIKDAMIKMGRDTIPHFIQLERTAGLENLLIEPKDTHCLGDIFCSFGSIDQVCSLEIIGEKLEDSARRLHEKYQTFNIENLNQEEQQVKRDSANAWPSLAETMKVSNRRAIDHLPAKLASAGCLKPTGLNLSVHPSFSMLVNDNLQLERISELEQKSWSAGRYVDGWRGGKKRDNKRKIHNMLGKKYHELDEQTKEYDRDQVRMIDADVLERNYSAGSVGRYDHWIGFIGHNQITNTEADWLKEQLNSKLLPALVHDNPNHHFTIVTPLAPGADALMSDVAREYFDQRDIPHRLIVIEAVAADDMIADFETAYDTKGYIGFGVDGTLPWHDGNHKTDGQRAITTKRHDLIEETCDWLISLHYNDADFSDLKAREAGYKIAAEYINKKSHTLVAACRDGSKVKPGGTAASLKTRKQQIEQSDLRWWAGGEIKTITLDPLHNKVIEDVL